MAGEERVTKLKIDNVKKIYQTRKGEMTALNGVNLDIKENEFICVVGPSGCGKSTLLNIIAGLDTPTSGAVYIDGKKIEGTGTERGVVFQQYALFPWLTVLKNVMFGLKLQGKSDAEAKEIAMKYIKIVEEKSTLRRLIKTANEIIELGYSPTEDVEDIMEGAEKKIFNIMQEKNQKGYAPIKDVLVESFTKLEELYNRKQHITGVPSGFTELDYRTAGFHGSELILIAARPAMGKTAFALNIATNAAVKANVPVAVFSLEMSKEQLVNRILCSESMVDSNKVRTGKLEEDDWTKLAGAIGPLSEAEIFIDDTPGINITEIRAKCRKLKLEKNIGMVVIDYLQLIQGSNKRGGSREQEISEISRSLKILAKELDVPVIALSQLSRAAEQRPDHRPMLSDLRESGAIEQDADIVMFLYRDDYYNQDSEKKDIAEIIIAKHRGGSTGTVELLWLGSYTKFVNLERRFDD